MSHLIGQNLGPYQIVEQIGQGSMATVFKAYQPTRERQVAIKVLPRHFVQDPSFAERFNHEARTIARLEHPHILPVYDYGQADDGTAYLVMRYLEARTLADLLKEDLPLLEVCRLFLQLGQAIAYAHSQGVIHRDIKPANVLVDQQGQVFVTDFGLARMMTGDSSLAGSMILGTPAYLAPEQSEGLPGDKRSDIYTLGIVLYEMTTGQLPFEAETPMAVMLKQMTDVLRLPRQINPNLPVEVERLILKALARNPDDRFQEVAQMTRALQEATGFSDEPAPPSSQSATPLTAVQPSTSPKLMTTPAPRDSITGQAWFWLALILIALLLIAGLVFIVLGPAGSG